MEISRDVWRWLVSVQAVASVRASKQTTSDPNVVRVDQQTQAAMEVRALSINPKRKRSNFPKKGVSLLVCLELLGNPFTDDPL